MPIDPITRQWVPTRPFVKPEPILPGSEEERFARHRHQFAFNVLDEESQIEELINPAPFDLEDLNRIRGFVAWKIYNKEQMDDHDACLGRKKKEAR